MTEFTFKPALLAAALTYELEPETITCRDKHGHQKWRLDWNQITSAAYVEYKVKASRMRRLDLTCDTPAQKYSISYTGGPGNPATDPDGVAQLDLMSAILTRLATRDPAFMVGIGEYGRSRMVIFGIGVTSMVSAIGLGSLVFTTSASADRLGSVAVPVLLLVAFGAGLSYSYAPWRKTPKLSAKVLAKALRLLAHPKQKD